MDPSAKPSPPTAPPVSAWGRLREHKVLQWGLAYLGAALALAHGQELVGQAFGWPEITNRVTIGVLALGFPIAITVAWYHGHRGMARFSTAEATVISILVLIGAGLLIALVRTPEEHGAQAARTASAPGVAHPNGAATEPPRASVAVVPFANLTGDASKEYFSDGMAEELINALAHVQNLKVPARTSSFAYKGRNVDIRQIARDLGVAAILEGSVRSAGERIRVSAQLVDASTGYHIWSDTYDRQFADVFKLQDDLAAAIVQALSGYLNVPAAALAARPRPTEDLEAYRLYLQGRSVLRSGEDSVRRSISLYDQAIARDPNFAKAYAGRAESRIVSLLNNSEPDLLESEDRDAAKALALDPGLALAYEARGVTNAFRKNLLAAEEDFHAALKADPTDARIRARHAAWVLSHAGRLLQARVELSEAYRLAPADALIQVFLAVTSSRLGDDKEALRAADLLLALGGSDKDFPLPLVYIDAAIRDRRYSEAAMRATRLLPAAIRASGGADVMNLVFSVPSDASKKRAAVGALQGLMHKMSAGRIDLNARELFIEMFVMLGALDEAFQAHRDLTRLGAATAESLLWSPEMRPFRRDPRFQAIAAPLIDYWKAYGPPDACSLEVDNLVCR
jgi:TolB-like protein